MPETLKIDGKMNVHIIMPTSSVLDDVADKIILPTEDGDLMILWDRAPLFVQIKAGLVWVYNRGQRPVGYYVSNGFAEVRRNICAVLAWGVKADAVDKTLVHKRRLEAEDQLGKINSDLQRQELMKRIDFFKMLESKPSLIVPPNFD